MKTAGAFLLLVILGALTGIGLFIMAMSYGWPYPSFDWLSYVLKADGESAYDAMMLELIIEAIVLYVAAWLAHRFWKSRRRVG
jgi:hypothetical protein